MQDPGNYSSWMRSVSHAAAAVSHMLRLLSIYHTTPVIPSALLVFAYCIRWQQRAVNGKSSDRFPRINTDPWYMSTFKSIPAAPRSNLQHLHAPSAPTGRATHSAQLIHRVACRSSTDPKQLSAHRERYLTPFASQ